MSGHPQNDILRFLIVGVINTTIHFLVLSLFYKVFNFDIVISTIIAFSCAVLFAYVANYFYTFNSNQPHKSSIPKFAITMVLGLFFNAGIMLVGVEKLGWNFYLVFIMATSVVMVNSFLLNKFWVYKHLS